MSHWTFRLCKDTYQKRISNTLPEGHTSDELGALLSMAKAQNTTKEQDRVFAILGLCIDSLGITADYGREVPELFRDVARRLMKSFQKTCPHCGPACLSTEVSILYLAERSEARSDLPSWVPDWKASLAPASLWAKQEGGGYRAAGSTQCQVSFPVNQDHVQVKAKICGRVIKMSEPTPDDSGSRTIPISSMDRMLLGEAKLRTFQHHAAKLSHLIEWRLWIGATFELRADCHAYEGNYQKDVAFWRTLCGNITKARLDFSDQLVKIPTDVETERRYDRIFRDFLVWIDELNTMVQAGGVEESSLRARPIYKERVRWISKQGLADTVSASQTLHDRHGTSWPGPDSDDGERPRVYFPGGARIHGRSKPAGWNI